MNSSTSWCDSSFSIRSSRIGFPFVIQPDLDLWKIKVERTVLETVLPQERREFPGDVETFA